MCRRLLAGAAALALACAALAACSVVDDGKVSRINPPGDLDDTLPATTSTSTTLVPTSTSGLETSTSLVQTELVRLYYIAGGQVTFVNQALPSSPVLQLIVSALQSGPPPDTPGLRSAIPQTAVILVRPPDGTGVAQVDLPDNFFDEIAVADQRFAIAQIVLTLTDSRGIGQVVFDLPVTKPSGEFVAAGKPVTHLDYESLTGVSSSPESVTGTSTSAPGT